MNDEAIRDELDMLEEARIVANLRNQNDKLRVAKHFNKKVRERSFFPGDLVLKEVKQPRKLQSQWEGHMWSQQERLKRLIDSRM